MSLRLINATCHEDIEVKERVSPRILYSVTVISEVSSKWLRFSRGEKMTYGLDISHTYS